MAPIPPNRMPRLVLYHQTHHDSSGQPVSILPLIRDPSIQLTHLIIAAIHLNHGSGPVLTLNDHAPSHPRNVTLWAEVRAVQASGVKVLGMLGGAAKGTFALLNGHRADFLAFYTALLTFIQHYKLDGIDLDIEEPMALENVVRLIDRLRADFGPNFIITMAPVAAALFTDQHIETYAEFSYEALEVLRGKDIAWYNTQFYCGWGDMSRTVHFDAMIARGFPANKIVVGLVTNPENGKGFVSFEVLGLVLWSLKGRYPELGGVMGWEYFNSLPGDRQRPWEWASWMRKRLPLHGGVQSAAPDQNPTQQLPVAAVDVEKSKWDAGEAELPREFEYIDDDVTP